MSGKDEAADPMALKAAQIEEAIGETLDEARRKVERAAEEAGRGMEEAVGNARARVAEAAADWLRVIPFIGLHVACIGVFFTGVSAFALAVAAFLYALRMFAITGFYHRYFSHKAFKTSRPMQFLFGLIGASSVQRGPLWWAAHHRHHHRHSDHPSRSAFAGAARLLSGATWAGS
jgi:hypothetical protein